MKRFLPAVAILILFFSCTSVAVKDIQTFSAEQDVSISLQSFRYDLKRIKKDENMFVPIKKGQRILESDFLFVNDGSSFFEPLDDAVIELVCVSGEGVITFFPAEDPFAVQHERLTYKAVREKKPVDPYSGAQRSYCFVYDKTVKPAFISVNRTSFIDLFLLKDSAPVLEQLVHHSHIEKIVASASSSDFNTINSLMQSSGVSIDETDSKNWTMLISAIASHNNSLFDSLVLHGADIFKETLIQGYTVTPLHAAVLACNTHASDFLLSMGAVLEDGSGNSPASLAVKTQNIESLEFLKNRGYDFSELKIRDTVFTDKLFTPQIYAKRNSFSDVESFFSSLGE